MLNLEEIVLGGSYLLTAPEVGTFGALLDTITGDSEELYVFKKITPETSVTEIIVLDKNEYSLVWICEELPNE